MISDGGHVEVRRSTCQMREEPSDENDAVFHIDGLSISEGVMRG